MDATHCHACGYDEGQEANGHMYGRFVPHTLNYSDGQLVAKSEVFFSCPRCGTLKVSKDLEKRMHWQDSVLPDKEFMPFGNDYSDALRHVKNGGRINRPGRSWFVRMHIPSGKSRMTHRYLYIEYGNDCFLQPGSRLPWTPTQDDQLANDWELRP